MCDHKDPGVHANKATGFVHLFREPKVTMVNPPFPDMAECMRLVNYFVDYQRVNREHLSNLLRYGIQFFEDICL